MSLRQRFTAPSPHLLDPLERIVGNLCPDLTGTARRRVARMADTMREVTEATGGCTRDDLLRAGFTTDEITYCEALAQTALAQHELPEEAASPFDLKDAAVLRRFAAQRAAAAQAQAA